MKINIEDFIQDEMIQKTMESISKTEKNYGRIEKRTAFVTDNISWLEQKNDWKNLCCIGAIHTEVSSKSGNTSEWHYYISSRSMSPEQLLHHAHME